MKLWYKVKRKRQKMKLFFKSLGATKLKGPLIKCWKVMGPKQFGKYTKDVGV